MTITHHIVTVSPPDNTEYWSVKCSQHDLDRTFHSRLLAYQTATGHINEVVERSELSRGYQFDDGITLAVSSSSKIQDLLNTRLDIEHV